MSVSLSNAQTIYIYNFQNWIKLSFLEEQTVSCFTKDNAQDVGRRENRAAIGRGVPAGTDNKWHVLRIDLQGNFLRSRCKKRRLDIAIFPIPKCIISVSKKTKSKRNLKTVQFKVNTHVLFTYLLTVRFFIKN